MSSTRNLAADQFQLISTNIISLTSIITNIFGTYIVIRANVAGKSKFIHLSYHFVLFVSQFYVGTVLNIVILIPVPGMYCIGWLKEASDAMKVFYIAIFFILFSLQGELLAIILFLKIGSVARPESIFKLRPFYQLVLILIFISFNHGLHWIIFYFTYSSRAELEVFIINNFPHHQFLLRYSFIWMMMSNKLYISFSAVNLCSVGIIILSICICYVLVLFELERRKSELSKDEYNKHKEFIDEIVSHGATIFPFFAILPACWFIQFFVLEEADVSFFVTICFLIFVSAPIPAMLKFLWRNPTYRSMLLKVFCIGRHSFVKPVVVSAQGT